MDAEDPLVFVMRDALDGVPVLTVYHEADGDWQYVTELEATVENARLVRQSQLYALDPALLELHGMPPGTWAVRQGPGHPWAVGDDDG